MADAEAAVVQHVRASEGDYAAVLLDEKEWVLGRVAATTKGDGRVKLLDLGPERGTIKVGPKHLIRLAESRKLDLTEAERLMAEAPPCFTEWELARDYLAPAKRKGT